ncbi:MAG: dihydroorotate dehydrogenase [Bacteroidota bacterium]|jgi:dihydroorotate dehydrogenase
MFYKFILKPILFLFPPENVHYFVTGSLRFFCKIPGFNEILKANYLVEDSRLEREVFGLKFKNPVGLAAGFDKNAENIDEFSSLGFGFIEIGTVTPKAQDGNPKPRLFRIIEDEAVLNRMGFNNYGVEAIKQRLIQRKSNLIIGGNLGKNKITPNENAVDDYLISFKELFDYVDYFVVNVSSPNTPNLRELQEKKPLEIILSSLQKENKKYSNPKPILLKIAPDLTDSQLNDIVDLVKELNLDGLIATNTTISREDLTDKNKWQNQLGGISGKPLTKRSTEIIRYLNNRLEGKVPIIGVGGIMNEEDALEKLEAGASLIQLYSGFIYEGPNLIKRINQAILHKIS